MIAFGSLGAVWLYGRGDRSRYLCFVQITYPGKYLGSLGIPPIKPIKQRETAIGGGGGGGGVLNC